MGTNSEDQPGVFPGPLLQTAPLRHLVSSPRHCPETTCKKVLAT